MFVFLVFSIFSKNPCAFLSESSLPSHSIKPKSDNERLDHLHNFSQEELQITLSFWAWHNLSTPAKKIKSIKLFKNLIINDHPRLFYSENESSGLIFVLAYSESSMGYFLSIFCLFDDLDDLGDLDDIDLSTLLRDDTIEQMCKELFQK